MEVSELRHSYSDISIPFELIPTIMNVSLIFTLHFSPQTPLNNTCVFSLLDM